MALKKPVISFSSGGPMEIIENNHNGYLVEDLDCKLFANCITKLYVNKDLYTRFSNNSYNRYLDLFSVKFIVQSTWKILSLFMKNKILLITNIPTPYRLPIF